MRQALLAAAAMLCAVGAFAEQAYWSEWTGPLTIRKVAALAQPRAAAPATVATDGPAAALDLERSLRGRRVNKAAESMIAYDGRPEHMYYPDAQPVPMNPERIIPMTPELWTDEQIMADFQKNHTPEQEGILIFLKTEYCHKNKYRLCAVATAALDKRSTPALARFRIYGAWLGKLNPRHGEAAYAVWQDKVSEMYEFDQGPGSNFFIMVPKPGQEPVFFRTDAARMQMYRDPFEAESGKVPLLEKVLEAALSSTIRSK